MSKADTGHGCARLSRENESESGISVSERAEATVVLTVCDHERNGFIGLARFGFPLMGDARRFVATVDAMVEDDAEPDRDEAPFWFLLDLHEGDDVASMIDNSRRLPTQVAHRVAPEAVNAWLAERPDPNLVAGDIPRLDVPAF